MKLDADKFKQKKII